MRHTAHRGDHELHSRACRVATRSARDVAALHLGLHVTFWHPVKVPISNRKQHTFAHYASRADRDESSHENRDVTRLHLGDARDESPVPRSARPSLRTPPALATPQPIEKLRSR